MNCKHCHNPTISNYCHECGHPTQVKRIDARYFMHELEHVLHFERGILYTMRELVLNPGKTVKDYISENRSRLVKPIIFIVVTSLLYTIVVSFFHVEDGYINYSDKNIHSVTSMMFKWVQTHYGYSNIIIGIFIALWLKVFFRSEDYNLFELLILLCFIMGISMLIFALFGLIEGITHLKTLQVGAILAMIYVTWAIGQFYNKKKPASYVKAFIAYLLGTFSISVIILFIGGIIDGISNH
jgi:hypothetical protein